MLPMERVEVMSKALPDDTQAIEDSAHRELVEKIRAVVLETPGHAEYFANRIREARKKVDEASPEDQGQFWHPLNNEQMYGFQTLGQLPSPETIRVLGEFLYDERGLFPKYNPALQDRARNRGENANSDRALMTLARMPLIFKPVQPRIRNHVIYDEDINAWRLWYEQIKAGTRTFRFEGDPQEYSLAGPVSEARVPQGDGASRKAPRSPAEASASPLDEKKSLPVWSLVGASLLLATALWLATRRNSHAD